MNNASKALGVVIANTIFVAAIFAGFAGLYLYTGSMSILGFMVVLPSAVLAAQVAISVGTGLFFVLSLIGQLFGHKKEKIA